jgi:hypothetical protein
MSFTDHRGAAVDAAHCSGLSVASRLSSRPRWTLSGSRTSTTGTSPIRMPLRLVRGPVLGLGPDGERDAASGQKGARSVSPPVTR